MRGNFTNHPAAHPRVTRTCPCGANFRTTQARIDAGRGKYCSRTCRYAYAERRSGLTYELKAANPAWFKPGSPQPRGANSPGWAGESVSYRQLHRWVARNKQKPAVCERCSTDGPLDWANISHEYRRDLADWQALCRPCHRRHDSGPARGAATAKYGRKAVQEG